MRAGVGQGAQSAGEEGLAGEGWVCRVRGVVGRSSLLEA